MPQYVCDTSVIVKWFNQESEANVRQAEALLEDWIAGTADLLTCDVAVLELANALAKGKGLASGEVKEAVEKLFDLPLETRPTSRELARKTVELAGEYGLTAYDACFVALAKLQGCRLISDNPRHHGKVRDGTVLMLQDYPVSGP